MAALLEEQKAYYDARAGEYDEWWERRGRYDLGLTRNAQWHEEIRKVEAIFDRAPLRGHILEPAAGTGYWTQYLAGRAEKVTVLDNSRSMIDVNRRRIQEAGLQQRVDYEEADLFSWHSRAQYDAIFLAFWISHLPSALLDGFLLLMASALNPGGCLAILEGQQSGTLRLRSPRQGTYRLDDELERRTLNDGRKFRIVKRYDTPDDLAERLRRASLKAQAGNSGEQFLYALAFRPN
jgi:demethylmenaquinone methyltransferase/2-methoxy-6-polyprenyl-1,4-benzoquinol methylase